MTIITTGSGQRHSSPARVRSQRCWRTRPSPYTVHLLPQPSSPPPTSTTAQAAGDLTGDLPAHPPAPQTSPPSPNFAGRSPRRLPRPSGCPTPTQPSSPPADPPPLPFRGRRPKPAVHQSRAEEILEAATLPTLILSRRPRPGPLPAARGGDAATPLYPPPAHLHDNYPPLTSRGRWRTLLKMECVVNITGATDTE